MKNLILHKNCHPERSGQMREAHMHAESKDPYQIGSILSVSGSSSPAGDSFDKRYTRSESAA